MVQRIKNYKRVNKSGKYDELLRMAEEDIAFLQGSKELNNGSIKDQINRGQWTLSDCLQLNDELKALHDGGKWSKSLSLGDDADPVYGDYDTSILVNKNLLRYDSMVFFDMDIPLPTYRSTRYKWSYQWEEREEKESPAEKVKRIRPELYNKVMVNQANSSVSMKHTVGTSASPWYGWPSFKTWVEETKSDQYANTTYYIRQAYKNEDGNREEFRDWLQAKWVTMTAKANQAAQQQKAETPTPEENKVPETSPTPAKKVEPIVKKPVITEPIRIAPPTWWLPSSARKNYYQAPSYQQRAPTQARSQYNYAPQYIR